MLHKNYKKTPENKKVIKKLNSDKDISDTEVYFAKKTHRTFKLSVKVKIYGLCFFLK